MCLQFPSSQLSAVVVFCLATDHNNTVCPISEYRLFLPTHHGPSIPCWWQLSSLQSDVMWRWLPSVTNMVTACKQCHVSRVTCGHQDTEDTPPAYLHISPRLRCQCCSLTFSSFYTDQETFDPSLQSPGRHCSTAALPIQWRILNYDK